MVIWFTVYNFCSSTPSLLEKLNVAFASSSSSHMWSSAGSSSVSFLGLLFGWICYFVFSYVCRIGWVWWVSYCFFFYLCNIWACCNKKAQKNKRCRFWKCTRIVKVYSQVAGEDAKLTLYIKIWISERKKFICELYIYLEYGPFYNFIILQVN